MICLPARSAASSCRSSSPGRKRPGSGSMPVPVGAEPDQLERVGQQRRAGRPPGPARAPRLQRPEADAELRRAARLDRHLPPAVGQRARGPRRRRLRQDGLRERRQPRGCHARAVSRGPAHALVPCRRGHAASGIIHAGLACRIGRGLPGYQAGDQLGRRRLRRPACPRPRGRRAHRVQGGAVLGAARRSRGAAAARRGTRRPAPAAVTNSVLPFSWPGQVRGQQQRRAAAGRLGDRARARLGDDQIGAAQPVGHVVRRTRAPSAARRTWRPAGRACAAAAGCGRRRRRRRRRRTAAGSRRPAWPIPPQPSPPPVSTTRTAARSGPASGAGSRARAAAQRAAPEVPGHRRPGRRPAGRAPSPSRPARRPATAAGGAIIRSTPAQRHAACTLTRSVTTVTTGTGDARSGPWPRPRPCR